jgi:hypothetical protein
VVCGDGTIPNGDTATIQLIVLTTACGVGPIVNTATLNNPVVANNTATSITTFTGCNTVTLTPTITQTPTITLTPTVTLTPTLTRTPTVTLTSTPVLADLDTRGGEGVDNLVSGTPSNWTSQHDLFFHNDGTLATGTITFTTTIGGTAVKNGIGGTVAGGSGGVCAAPVGPAFPSAGPYTIDCTVNPLAVDNGTPFDNDLAAQADPNTNLDADQARVRLTVTGSNGAIGQTITYSATSPNCANPPGPCVDGFAGGSNSDGGTVTIPADPDALVASGDLDNQVCTNQARATCNSDGGAVEANAVGVPEDLTLAGGSWRSQNVYDIDNDGTAAIGGITVTGNIDPASTAVFAGGVLRPGVSGNIIFSGGSGGGWACVFTNPATLTWQCTGSLAADSGGDNDDISILVEVLGTSGGVGETIIYNATRPTCTTPGPCVDDTSSLANSDASDLDPPVGDAAPWWLQVTDLLT